MTQLSLDWMTEAFHPQNARPLARKSDPVTSHKAATRVVTFQKRHHAAIYGAIFDAGDKGATYREIAQATGMEPVAVGRRLKELRENAGIYADGERNGCQVWKART